MHASAHTGDIKSHRMFLLLWLPCKESMLSLSVNSFDILNVYFLYGTHCLLHTWACYILSVHTGATDNEMSIYYCSTFFFLLCLCWTFLTYWYNVSFVVDRLNAATAHNVLLDLKHVIGRLNISSQRFLFCLTWKVSAWCLYVTGHLRKRAFGNIR